jgi:hypothetical protein
MFWLGIGIIIGAGFVLLATRAQFKLAWFDWVFLVLAIVFGLLAVQNYAASMQELEPKAAFILLVLFGVPAAIFGAIVGVRAWRQRPTAGVTPKQS